MTLSRKSWRIPNHGTSQVMENVLTQARQKQWENHRKWSGSCVTLSPEAKQARILASLRGEISMADLCRRAPVPESTFRDGRDRFMAAGMAALQPGKPAKGDAEKPALIQENARLKTVVADLSGENLVLKKGRNRAWSPASI